MVDDGAFEAQRAVAKICQLGQDGLAYLDSIPTAEASEKGRVTLPLLRGADRSGKKA